MIDIFDVRANNWIAIAGQPVLVREITYSPLVTDNCRINNVPASKVEGLAITFEILEKSGFNRVELDDEIFYYEIETDRYEVATGDKNGICEVVFSLLENELRRVKYVHDLQNAYRWLTETELNIKF